MSNLNIQQVADAMNTGNRSKARELLMLILADDLRNVDALLWMAAASDTADERHKWLLRVLEIDPNNPKALRGIEVLGPVNQPAQVTEPPDLLQVVTPSEQTSTDTADSHRMPPDEQQPQQVPVATPAQSAEEQKIKGRKTSGRWIIASLLVVIIVAALIVYDRNNPSSSGNYSGSSGGSSSGCSSANYWYSEVRGLIQRFDDANTLAQSTPRIQLSSVIADMQSIRREAKDVIALDCTENAHQAMIAYMDQIILAYTKFMAQADDSEITSAFKRASDLLDQFTNEVKKISQ